MSFQCVGHRLQNLDAGGPGAGTPVFKEPACDGFVGLSPDLTEILLMLDQQPAKTLQSFPAHLVGFTLEVSAKLSSTHSPCRWPPL